MIEDFTNVIHHEHGKQTDTPLILLKEQYKVNPCYTQKTPNTKQKQETEKKAFKTK